MDEFVKNLHFGEALILLLVICGIIIGVLFFLYKIISLILKKNFKIKGKSSEFEIGDNNDLRKKAIYLLSTDLYFIVEKITIANMEKANILLYEKLKQQMDSADQRIKKFQTILEEEYSRILRERLGGDVNIKLNDNYLLYRALLYISVNKIKDYIKATFKQNDIPDYDSPLKAFEWKNYIDHKFDVIMQEHSHYFDVMYLDTVRLVNREEIQSFTHKEEIYSALREIIENIYIEAVNIKRKTDKKIHDVDINLTTFIENILLNKE